MPEKPDDIATNDAAREAVEAQRGSHASSELQW